METAAGTGKGYVVGDRASRGGHGAGVGLIKGGCVDAHTQLEGRSFLTIDFDSAEEAGHGRW